MEVSYLLIIYIVIEFISKVDFIQFEEVYPVLKIWEYSPISWPFSS